MGECQGRSHGLVQGTAGDDIGTDGLAFGISAPVWAIVALGIGAGVAAGVILDWLDSEFNIIGKTKALFDKIGDRIDPVMTSFEAEHRVRVMSVPTPAGFWGSLPRAY